MNISKYADMAKIPLTDDEIAVFEKRVDMIMSTLAKITAVDTTSAQPMITPIKEGNVMRRDVQSKSISREELLAGAPEQYNGYFQVPKTVGN